MPHTMPLAALAAPTINVSVWMVCERHVDQTREQAFCLPLLFIHEDDARRWAEQNGGVVAQALVANAETASALLQGSVQ